MLSLAASEAADVELFAELDVAHPVKNNNDAHIIDAHLAKLNLLINPPRLTRLLYKPFNFFLGTYRIYPLSRNLCNPEYIRIHRIHIY